MSKLSNMMRESISAEKQSLEQGHIDILDSMPPEYETYHNLELGFFRHYYEMYAAIVRSQAKLWEIIQKEQVSVIQNNIASGFAVLNSFKTGFKSLQS